MCTYEEAGGKAIRVQGSYRLQILEVAAERRDQRAGAVLRPRELRQREQCRDARPPEGVAAHVGCPCLLPRACCQVRRSLAVLRGFLSVEGLPALPACLPA